MDDYSMIFYLLLAISLILISGFFSGSESAFFSLNPIQYEKLKKNENLISPLNFFLKYPRRLIIAILIGNEIVNVFFSILITYLISIYVGESKGYLSIFIATSLLLFFGEITPKTIAITYPESFSKFNLVPLYLFYKIVSPLVNILRKLVQLIGGKHNKNGNIITEKEFITLVDAGKDQGVFETQESEMIHNVFEFGDTVVSEVLTPRTDMFLIEDTTDIETTIAKIKEMQYSRVPVYENTPDNIIGIIYSKELLLKVKSDVEINSIREILRSPFLVPESKRVNDLLKEFQKNKVHMAIVIDEYGGVEGLVTLEDLLEEIVGEIADEFDKKEKQFQNISDGIYRVSTLYSIKDFNQKLETEIEDVEFDTIGGYVYHLFGKIPKKGEMVSDLNFNFIVEKTKGTRVTELKIERIKKNVEDI